MDVFEHVVDEVARDTGNGQTPWINSSFRGDFYFTGPVTIVPPPAAPLSSENLFWQSIMGSKNPADFEAYLKQYPDGSFAALARNRLASLSMPPVVPPRLSVAPESKSSKPSSPPIAKQKPMNFDNSSSEKPVTTAMAMPRAPVPSIAAPPVPSPATPESPVQSPTPSVQSPYVPRKQYCNIPSTTGIDTAAGAYVTIKVVNIGRRCGSYLRNRFQPTDFNLSISTPPSHGTITFETGSHYYYTPDPGYVGSDNFSLTASPYGKLRAEVTVLSPESKLETK
jgi:hypothetical protein